MPNWTHAALNLPIGSHFKGPCQMGPVFCTSIPYPRTMNFGRVIEGIRVNTYKNCVPFHKGNLGMQGILPKVCRFDLWPFERRSATMQLEISPKCCKSTFAIDIFIWSAVCRQKSLGKRRSCESFGQTDNDRIWWPQCLGAKKINTYIARNWCKLHWGFGNASRN